MNSGVYIIKCNENCSYYIGSSVDLRSRKSNHINKLKNGNHRNKRLQRVYDKYGNKSLSFDVILYCERGQTTKLEQFYLDQAKGDLNCLNFCWSAEAPMLGQKFTRDHARKIAESQQRNTYEFHFSNGEIKSYKSLRLSANAFNVRPSIVSKWFKRKDLGRKHGFLSKFNVVMARKIGDESITLLPYKYKMEAWQIAGASSKSSYYKSIKKLCQLARGTHRGPWI